jgi:hypothetical protein
MKNVVDPSSYTESSIKTRNQTHGERNSCNTYAHIIDNLIHHILE